MDAGGDRLGLEGGSMPMQVVAAGLEVSSIGQTVPLASASNVISLDASFSFPLSNTSVLHVVVGGGEQDKSWSSHLDQVQSWVQLVERSGQTLSPNQPAGRTTIGRWQRGMMSFTLLPDQVMKA
eukprot:2607978-Rhodomonas_salina.1